MTEKRFPGRGEVYKKLKKAALAGDNVAFLEAHRLLTVHLIADADGDVAEQARISSELLRLTKELIVLQGRGDEQYALSSSIGEVSLEDVE